MSTLKELAATAKIVTEVALEKSLIELKNYIDTQDQAGGSSADAKIKAVSDKLDALIGSAEGDADKVINTFNEIKEFLKDYSEDDTLKSLLDAVNTAANTAVGTEKARAEAAETALGSRISALENVSVMTSDEAKTLFDGVFNPKD